MPKTIAVSSRGTIRQIDGQIKVDPCDQYLLEMRTWYINKRGYVANDGYGRKKIGRCLLHCVIMDAQPGELVDHINHDTLDNRRENLRKTTKAVNCQNRSGAQKNSKSGIKGICLIQRTGRNDQWLVQKTVNKKPRAAYFTNLEDAQKTLAKWESDAS